MAEDPTFTTFKLEEKEPRHGLQWFRGQVPNGLSGVVAGTYGDSTHVGRFTVNALGIITQAANIDIGSPVSSNPTAGTTINIGIEEYATPDADQVLLAPGDNYVVYPHGLSGVPHSVRWVIIPTQDIAGYLAGDEIPIEMFRWNAVVGPNTSIGGPRVIDDTNLEFYCYIGIITAQTVANKDTWDETNWRPTSPNNDFQYALKAYAIL